MTVTHLHRQVLHRCRSKSCWRILKDFRNQRLLVFWRLSPVRLWMSAIDNILDGQIYHVPSGLLTTQVHDPLSPTPGQHKIEKSVSDREKLKEQVAETVTENYT